MKANGQSRRREADRAAKFRRRSVKRILRNLPFGGEGGDCIIRRLPTTLRPGPARPFGAARERDLYEESYHVIHLDIHEPCIEQCHQYGLFVQR